jgi:hypothetical protein
MIGKFYLDEHNVSIKYEINDEIYYYAIINDGIIILNADDNIKIKWLDKLLIDARFFPNLPTHLLLWSNNEIDKSTGKPYPNYVCAVKIGDGHGLRFINALVSTNYDKTKVVCFNVTQFNYVKKIN